MTTILFVLGTRSEVIGLSPMIRAVAEGGRAVAVAAADSTVEAGLLATAMAELELGPPGHRVTAGPGGPTARVGGLMAALEPVLQEVRPDLVVVHGTTAPALAGALCAHRLGFPVAAVATLATGHDPSTDRDRALIEHLADLRLQPPPANDGGSAVAAIGAFLTAAQRRPRDATTLPSDGDRTGRALGREELELVARAIDSGTLNSTRGTFVARFEKAFAERMGARFAIACASGSAAVHCAVAALDLAAGDEVITTPITDMGAITPILYQGAVPVFADVDPENLTVTADTIRAQLTDRTRAIVVTHLFGRCCDMPPILALATERRLPVIEDVAQAFLAEDRAGPAGRLGALSCYSLQQGKHMTTGEGGVVTTDDPALARRVLLFVNKAWGYGDPDPDHYFPALNYRLTELQGAVAVAQLQKLDGVVQRRRAVAAALTAGLQGIDGLTLPGDPPGGRHSWWKYALGVDPAVIPGGAVALGGRIAKDGVACAPRYIQKPAFECALFRDWSASPVTALPLSHNPRGQRAGPPFRRQDYPGTVLGLERVLVLPINEFYTAEHTDRICAVIRHATEGLRKGTATGGPHP